MFLYPENKRPKFISLSQVSQMNKVMISMLQAGEEPVLAGRLAGKRAFLRILEQLASASMPALVVLDFRLVDIATSSFISEAIFPLRDHLNRLSGYIVLANLSDHVREELEELLRRSSDALIACSMGRDRRISNVELVGRLDQKLQETFDLVIQKGETSAVELHTESRRSEKIGATAWNNRLATLAAKSLLVEIPHGRAKRYRLVLEIV
jgi:anti-anti-sigma regulatory factor